MHDVGLAAALQAAEGLRQQGELPVDALMLCASTAACAAGAAAARAWHAYEFHAARAAAWQGPPREVCEELGGCFKHLLMGGARCTIRR